MIINPASKLLDLGNKKSPLFSGPFFVRDDLALVDVVGIGLAVFPAEDDGLAVGEVPFAGLEAAGGLGIVGVVAGGNREAGCAGVPGVGLAVGQVDGNGGAGRIADFNQGGATALGQGATHRQHGEQDDEDNGNQYSFFHCVSPWKECECGAFFCVPKLG